ncbi:MAG: thioredoxin fold domain-containing protein [Deltaproteobacteria bacterium]|nr:thioredoxin fold domain-containing protein [Deltaproteobacteria bacterium]
MRLVTILIFLTIAQSILAFNYFDRKIDYWGSDRTTNPPLREKEPDKPNPPAFDWSKYSNPKSDEFFKEGNYTPPKPLMELARNPSDENIRNWFRIIETKNKLMAALQERFTEYLQTNKTTLTEEQKTTVERKVESLEIGNHDVRRFRFRLYFDSSCPHCKNMIATMKELQELGYYVEVHQIDRRVPEYSVPFPIIPASEKDIRERNISSWPTLFVADTTKKLTYRINGYLPQDQVLAILSTK